MEMTVPYLIEGSDQRFELWSSARLRYQRENEPSWMVRMRLELREWAAKMNASGQQVLAARHTSRDEDACDTENILFYNVGRGKFGSASRRGLQFERVVDDPPLIGGGGSHGYTEHHAYWLTDDPELDSYWRKTSAVGEARAVFAREKALRSLAQVWRLVRSGEISGEADVLQGQHFALRVELRGSVPASAAVLVKTVFDGVIAAFHVHDGSAAAEVATRLALQLEEPERAVAARLSDSRAALLGKRKLVFPRLSGVQWSPSDDHCVLGQLLIERSEVPQVELEATFWNVEPRD